MCFRLTAQCKQNYNKPALVSCSFEVGKVDEDQIQIKEVDGKLYGDDPFKLELTGQKGTGAVNSPFLTEMEFWSYRSERKNRGEDHRSRNGPL
ncbi:MAG: hypothetical protein ACLR78_06095 [Roseburia sp.]